MKKTVLSFVLTGLFFHSIAQSNSSGPKAKQFYVKGNMGYALGANQDAIGENSTNNSNPSGSSGTESVVFSSFGQGLAFGLGAGYMLNDYIGVELGAKYHLFSVPDVTNSSSEITNYYGNSNNSSYYSLQQESGSQLSILPSFILKAPLGKVSPYAKFGVVMPLINSLTNSGQENSTNYYYNTPSTNTFNEYDYKFKMGLGVQTSVGVFIGLSEKVSLFTELSYIGLSLSPDKSTITKSTSNGIDVTASLTTYQKETDYQTSNSYSYSNTNSSTSIDQSQPRTALVSSPYSFSSIGLNVGIIVAFGGK